MGGGKRDYNAKERYRKWHPKAAEVKDDKKEPPKEEDVKSLMDLWLSNSKKKDEKESK